MNFLHALPLSLFVGISLWLAGCAASNPIKKGKIAPSPSKEWMPPYYGPQCAPVLPEAEQIEEEWKQHQGPWAVADLIDIALRNNPLTRESWEIARASAYNWKASQSILYPSVNLNENLLFQKITGPDIIAADASSIVVEPDVSSRGSRGTGSNQWVISTLSASYLLFDFGGRCASIESARQALLASNWSHNRIIQEVILDVLTSYYLHLQAKALFAAKEDDLKNALENVDAAEGQFAAGVKAKLDVLLVKSNLANTRLELEQNRGLVKTTLGRLATSLGLPANTEFEVEGLPEDIAAEKIRQDIEKLIDIAKQERPDLAAAEAGWKRATQDIIVARSEGLPTLSLNALAQNASNLRQSSLNSNFYSGSLTLNIPIFEGFLYVNQTRSAIAAANATYAAWKRQEQNVILEVVTSYYDFKTASETVKYSDEFYDYTKESYDVAFASYNSGVSTILDLLAAQTSLSNARAQRIQARTQWITSLTNVAYATGQL